MSLIKHLINITLLSTLAINLSGQSKVISVTFGSVKVQSSIDSEGRMDGEYRRYHEGRLDIAGNYSAGKKQGLWTYYNDKDYTIVTYYKDDVPDSVCIHYLKKKEYFYQNRVTGETRFNYENGKPRIRTELTTDGLIRNGYFPNGDLEFRELPNGEERHFYKDGILKLKADSAGTEYITEEYYPDGKLLRRTVEGTEVIVTEYGKDGAIIGNIRIRNGLPIHIEKVSRLADIYYDGTLSEGNGVLEVKSKVGESDSTILVMRAELKNGKLNGPFQRLHSNGFLSQEGNYVNGYMSGKWISCHLTTGKKEEFTYSPKDQIVFDTINNIGFTSIEKMNTGIVDDMPTFMGKSVLQFSRWVAEKVSYPVEAQKSGISGKVLVGFIVNEFGLVDSVEIISGEHSILNSKAIDIVSSAPLWRPGFKGENPVKVRFTITVNFQLSEMQ